MTHQLIAAKLERALEALHRADFPMAVELLSEVVAEEPGNARAWQSLGVCYQETAQPGLAMEALTRSLRAQPLDATTHYLLGNAYGATGQLERAAACYRRALEIDPDHTKAEQFLIKAESLLESREHYRSGLKLLYGAAPTVGDLNRAIRELVQSAAIFEGSPARDNLLEAARGLFELRKEWTIPAEIPRELERWAAACERGFQCLQFRNWLGARAAYQEALDYRVQDAFVHHALGFSFVELGETGDAVRAWLRALEINADYDFTQFGRIRPAHHHPDD